MFDKIFDATRAQYIARPDGASQMLVYRHPDTTIPRGAKLTVRSDETAVFFREGRAVGVLKPGAYQLDTANIPFLGSLINKVTGGNHFLAEVFFVRTAENILSIGSSELGSFVDVNSRNLLRVLFDARVTVTVTDGLALITQIAGQATGGGDKVEEIVGARLRNCLKSMVAQEALKVPIYEIISNAGSEAFGANVLTRVTPEFTGQGLKLVRFLDLHLTLDDESMDLLREYQKRESDLVIDAKGAQVAQNNPGFATYNAVKGGRAVADGLGAGLSQGFSGPVIGLGGLAGIGGAGAGIGAAVPRGPSPQQAFDGARAISRGGADRFVLEGPNGPEGPYAARQVALWVLAAGRSPDTVRIRFENDPPDLWTNAAAEPTVMTEINRRRGGGAAGASAGGGSGSSAFETALAQSFRDGVLTADEMRLLVAMAVTSRTCANEPDARAMIEQRARVAGCRVEGAVAQTFAHWDGAQQSTGLAASDVIAKMKANPGATHMVWTAALGNWTDARQVPDIAALLAASAPPPPPAAPPPPPGR